MWQIMPEIYWRFCKLTRIIHFKLVKKKQSSRVQCNDFSHYLLHKTYSIMFQKCKLLAFSIYVQNAVIKFQLKFETSKMNHSCHIIYQVFHSPCSMVYSNRFHSIVLNIKCHSRQSIGSSSSSPALCSSSILIDN